MPSTVRASEPRLRCVIAGAGLGGLSAAIALRRAGHDVVVLEQADALGTVGAGIQMAPNASRLLEAWGVVDRFKDQADPAEAAVRRRWNDGAVLGEVPLGEELRRRVGASYWCLHRADLHAALVAVATAEDELGPPVEIRLGVTVNGTTNSRSGMAGVTTSTGKVEGDVVVGADGIRSRVRESLFPGQAPAFSGRVTNRHVLDAGPIGEDPELAPLLARPIQSIWLGPGGHVITHPIRGQQKGLYMGVTRAGIAAEDAFWSQEVDRDQLKASIEGWDRRILRLIDAASTVTAYGLYDSAPLETWHVDRVCLLGDACHAMLPFQAQGAAQAVEDGAVLAAALTGVSRDGVPAALARYAAARQPRTARVQQASRANGAQWHLPDGPEQRSRDAQLAHGSGDFDSYRWLWTVGPDGAPDPDNPLGA
jgi:salicylate hydroxylase